MRDALFGVVWAATVAASVLYVAVLYEYGRALLAFGDDAELILWLLFCPLVLALSWNWVHRELNHLLTSDDTGGRPVDYELGYTEGYSAGYDAGLHEVEPLFDDEAWNDGDDLLDPEEDDEQEAVR